MENKIALVAIALFAITAALEIRLALSWAQSVLMGVIGGVCVLYIVLYIIHRWMDR